MFLLENKSFLVTCVKENLADSWLVNIKCGQHSSSYDSQVFIVDTMSNFISQHKVLYSAKKFNQISTENIKLN